MKHELLAPAGSLKICKAVITAGADAVYLGGEKYGARAFARNFTEEELLEAIDFAHTYGKKIHLTVNTLLKNRETGLELFEYIKPFYQHGLDAIIVQDFGVFTFLKQNFPDLELHASTQMSIAGPEGAAFLKQQGASRAVLARELGLDEIRTIHENVDIDLETFIHGALCYCYSGQCLMSSMLGGRSGNRGRCAQPCRLAYNVVDEKEHLYHKKEKFPLSPKDLCTIEILPELCDAGIYSFKIEGRMKQLEYAAGVTGVYRRYLDAYEQDPDNYRVAKEDMDYLMNLGNRSGFTQGYYDMRNGRSMLSLTDSSHNSGQVKDFVIPDQLKKLPVSGRVSLTPDERAFLRLQCQDHSVDVYGDVVSEAQKRPLLRSDVEEKISKAGNSPFEITDLQIHMSDNCFMPVKQLNELRRNGLTELQKSVFGTSSSREIEKNAVLLSCKEKIRGREGKKEAGLNVVISAVNQLAFVLKNGTADRITLDLMDFSGVRCHSIPTVEEYASALEQSFDQIHQSGKEAGFCFPHVLRQNSLQMFENEKLAEIIRRADWFYVRSYDSLGLAWNSLHLNPERICLDHSLYVYSEQAWAAFEKCGISHYVASGELNHKELRYMPNAGAEFPVYGYQPLMISAQCVYKNYDHCMKSGESDTKLYLKDRYFKEFFINHNCKDCYNIIYNSQPLFLLHQADLIDDLGFEMLRIVFTGEKEQQISEILNCYDMAFCRHQHIDPPDEKDGFTNGHFRRGID